MAATHLIDSNPLDLSIIQDILAHDKKLSLSESAKERIKNVEPI